MKKILSILGTITLIKTSTTSLVACNITQYSEDELKKEKEKNNIKKNGILEWIASQEKPFNQVDNKYYFVVWRHDENNDWNLLKFKNDTNANFVNAIILEKIDKYYLYLGNYFKPPLDIGAGLTYPNLYIYKSATFPYVHHWDKNDNYFKSVYRWNSDKNIPNLVVDSKTGELKNEG